MTRHRDGHGSLFRDGVLAVPHVGYWIVEQRDASISTVSGQLRGDANVLDSLDRAAHQLLLVLDNGLRLPILLTQKHTDGLAWDFKSTATSLLNS